VVNIRSFSTRQTNNLPPSRLDYAVRDDLAYRTCSGRRFFCQDSEKVHDRTLRLSRLGRSARNNLQFLPPFHPPLAPSNVRTGKFPNRVGLAAGRTKQAAARAGLTRVGFVGFSELGGVTRQPQPATLPPRMFAPVVDRGANQPAWALTTTAPTPCRRLAEWRAQKPLAQHPVGIN